MKENNVFQFKKKNVLDSKAIWPPDLDFHKDGMLSVTDFGDPWVVLWVCDDARLGCHSFETLRSQFHWRGQGYFPVMLHTVCKSACKHGFGAY